MTNWQEAFEALYNNNDDVDVFKTTHHPYMHQGKPWGMEIEVGHNITKDIWVQIVPGSGSQLQIIDKTTADSLMADGYSIRSTTRSGVVSYTDPEGKVTTFKRQTIQ